MVLRWSSEGGQGLMSEVPLYSRPTLGRELMVANGSKNRPHDAYLDRCRVPAYYDPCSEKLRLCQLKNQRQLKKMLRRSVRGYPPLERFRVQFSVEIITCSKQLPRFIITCSKQLPTFKFETAPDVDQGRKSLLVQGAVAPEEPGTDAGTGSV